MDVIYASFRRSLFRYLNHLGRKIIAVHLFYMVRNCGGGYNGGRLTLEIAKNHDMYPTLLHELFHAFLQTKARFTHRFVDAIPGLDPETLSEGLACVLALRPLLNDALYGTTRQTLEAFLPRAVDAWLVLTELDKERAAT